jgi:hypothetical protein
MMQDIKTANLIRRVSPTETVIESIRKRVQSNPVKKESLPPIRDKVFSPELRSLATDIIGHNKKNPDRENGKNPIGTAELNPVLTARLENLMNGSAIDLPDYTIRALSYIYHNFSFPADSLDPVFRYILRITQADSLAWLMYDPNMQCHAITAELGLDAYTKKSFYAGLNDHYLDNDAVAQMIFFRGNLVREMNFKKRFSSSFYSKTDGAVFIDLNLFSSNGYLVLFFRDAASKNAGKILTDTEPLIRDILPAVIRRKNQLMNYKRRIQHTSYQIVYEFYRSLREISDSGKTRIHVIFIDPDAATVHSSFPVFFKQGINDIIGIIRKNERVFRISSTRLAVILSDTDPELLYSAIRELEGVWGFKSVMQINQYPNDFANVVNYHYQPYPGRTK